MNLDWAKTWLNDRFNQKDMEGLLELYSPSVKFEDVPLGVKADGHEGVRGFLGAFFDPKAGDHKFLPDAYLGDRKGGVVEWTWVATMGEADLFNLGRSTKGKELRVRGNSVFQFDDAGKVIEERDYWDLATALRQLGAL